MTPEPTDPQTEARFFRALHHVSNRIHNTERLEQIMLELAQPICDLFGADRMTLYTVNDAGNAIVSRVKTGLQTIREIKLPINGSSVAGFVALQRQLVNVANAHDDAEIARISPQLAFQKEVDKHSGYHTQQLLTAPVLLDDTLYGVLQLINTRDGQPFAATAEVGVQELCDTLAIAFKHRKPPTAAQALAEPSVSAITTAPAPVAATPYSPNPMQHRYQWLVQQHHLSAATLAQCLEQARQEGVSAEEVLLQHGIATTALGQSLADFFGVPYMAFQPGRLGAETLHGPLKREFVLAQGWLPLQEDEHGLHVVCLDPEAVRNSRMVQQVFPKTGRVVYGVTTRHEFFQTVEQFYGSPSGPSVDSLLANLADNAEDESIDATALASAAADNELVKLVNKIVVDAHQLGASDIHIEPQPGRAKTLVRLRIDGSLRPYIEVPASYRSALVTRIKIMCDLDIAERRKPQDGKIQFRRFGPLDIELRVATLPSTGGLEDVVMRLLASGEPMSLHQLGLSTHNLERLLPVIDQPYGLFYVCGPTGSGKTTTLHSILKQLNTPETKIWTAEDPVEITQKGLRQIQINKKAGIDFAMVMRAFLRADPDIIMVGESRDHETVSMGIEASLTGHLVFSTLHTNSAPESVVRLLDMGMDPFNFADALLGILAQRLTKKLCSCKQAYAASEAEIGQCLDEYTQALTALPDWPTQASAQRQAIRQRWQRDYGTPDGQLQLYRPVGCERCQNTGYKGRIGLHELLVTNEAIKQHIQNHARVAELLPTCLAGGLRTLKMDGIEKALQGVTDLKQVRAVCIH